MKVLVDKQTNEIRGWYKEPLDFSISGKYVIDVPEGVVPYTNVVADLLASKINYYQGDHSSLVNYFSDEFLATPDVDTTSMQSTGYTIGPYKRTALLPGGSIITNTLSTASGFTTTFFHFRAFLLRSDPNTDSPPGPNRLLYNNDESLGFIDFDPALFLIQYWDDPPTVPIATPVPIDNEWTTFSSGSALDFRIKIINNDPSRTFYISDWLFLYD